VGDDFGDMPRASIRRCWKHGKLEGDFEENVGRVKWDVYMPLIPIGVYMRGFCESAKEIK
jgi:hypothetical protein